MFRATSALAMRYTGTSLETLGDVAGQGFRNTADAAGKSIEQRVSNGLYQLFFNKRLTSDPISSQMSPRPRSSSFLVHTALNFDTYAGLSEGARHRILQPRTQMRAKKSSLSDFIPPKEPEHYQFMLAKMVHGRNISLGLGRV